MGTLARLIVVVMLCACHVPGQVEFSASMVVYQEPPAPKVERTPEVRDGFVWIAGRWESHGDQWTWTAGKYERARAGYAWNDGRWERRGNSWHWIDGQWTVGVSRDHRAEQAPVVRDHRE